MKHEEDPAAEKSDSGLRHEPLVIGISEGVTAGYEALEYVLEGLRQSLRRRRRTAPGEDHEAHETEHARHHRRHGEGPLDLDDLVGLFAELLESTGEVVEEVAYYIRDWAPATKHPKAHGRVVMRVMQGKRGEEKFRLQNRGSSVMRDVRLVATDLIGDKETIEAHNVKFDPDQIDKIPIGGAVEVTVVVAVTAETPPGTYSGLILTKPGGASTILDVKVVAASSAAAEEAPAEAA